MPTKPALLDQGLSGSRDRRQNWLFGSPRHLTIGIVAVDATSATSSLAATGARLLAVTGEAFTQPRYSTDAAACEALCRAATPPSCSPRPAHALLGSLQA